MLLDGSTIPLIARGAAVLGAGGGGDPLIGMLAALQAVEEAGPVDLVDLDDLPAEGLVLPCGEIGAPTVTIEKFGNGGEGRVLRDRVEESFDATVVAIMPSEIGGSNGLLPIAWAADMGLPLLDADGMGRAFPELPQVSMEVAGIRACPAFMTDERGNVVVTDAVDAEWLERIHRHVAVEMGGNAAVAAYVLTAAQARSAVIHGSVDLAHRIGRAQTESGDDVLLALADEVRGVVLVRGKVVDVERHTTGGFVVGAATVEGLAEDAGRLVRVEIQNENLVAFEDDRVLASVPDLITLLGLETADAIPTERLRYGQRVAVLAFPCAPVWRTRRGIELTGPRAFGYQFDHLPVEELHE